MFKPTTTTTMANEKTYIGNGRQKEGSAYIIIELDMNALLNCAREERDGRATVKAVLAKKMKPNGHGTHMLYVLPTADQEMAAQNALMDRQEEECGKW